MSRSFLHGIIFIIAGALLALVPIILLPVCEGTIATASGGSVPMKCFWTARTELGAGALVAFGGILYCVFRNAGIRFGIAIMTAGAALLAMAFPTVLIGVCASETMPCRMGTLPAIVLFGALVLVAALFACRGLSRDIKGKQ